MSDWIDVNDMLVNRITFALGAANGMYDDIYKKFLDWNAFGEECPSECNYMQDLKCVIESLELALKEIKKE